MGEVISRQFEFINPKLYTEMSVIDITIIPAPILEVEKNKIVSLVQTGNTSKIIFSKTHNTDSPIQKISKTEYVVKSTGERKEYAYKEDRGDSIEWLRKTMEHGRDMINANCTNPNNCLLVTLTYRQRENINATCLPMTDPKTLYHDIDVYHKRFRRKYGKEVRFIICAEPQGTGSWHAHIIYIFDHPFPFIPHEVIEKMWGKGFIKISRFKSDIDNYGAYLTAYLTNISTDEICNEKITEIFGDNPPKKIIKGTRLHFYPSYFHPFRFSKNCVKPKIMKMKYSDAQKLISNQSLVHVVSFSVLDENGNEINRIQKEFYKKVGNKNEYK